MTIPLETIDGRLTLPESAFYENESLTSLSLPEGVEVIGAAAFAGCTSLTQIQLPSTLQEIGEGAFLGCISLRHLSLPEGLTTIGEMAFWNCGLEAVTIPQTVAHIGDNAFWDCPHLSQAHVLNPAARIGVHAFGNCPSLVAGYMAPGFPADDSPPAQLLYSLLWCTCPEKHMLPTSVRARQFIREKEVLIMEHVLKTNNVAAMTGLVSQQLLSPQQIDIYLRQSLESGLTEITALLLAAKSEGPSLADDPFAL